MSFMQIKKYFGTRLKYLSGLFTRCVPFVLVMLMQISMVHAQQGITVSGTVTDNGETMPGVNVTVKGTTTGVVTDVNGRYSITVPNRDAVLIFSFVGYATQEFIVGDMREINVALSEETHEIEEVVVVAYGVQKKVSVTGAISTVQTKELKKSSAANFSAALSNVDLSVTVISDNEELPTSSDENLSDDPLRAWIRDGLLHISGLTPGETLSVYTVTGALDYHSIAMSKEANIKLKAPGMYIVQSGDKSVKVVFE